MYWSWTSSPWSPYLYPSILVSVFESRMKSQRGSPESELIFPPESHTMCDSPLEVHSREQWVQYSQTPDSWWQKEARKGLSRNYGLNLCCKAQILTQRSVQFSIMFGPSPSTSAKQQTFSSFRSSLLLILASPPQFYPFPLMPLPWPTVTDLHLLEIRSHVLPPICTEIVCSLQPF